MIIPRTHTYTDIFYIFIATIYTYCDWQERTCDILSANHSSITPYSLQPQKPLNQPSADINVIWFLFPWPIPRLLLSAPTESSSNHFNRSPTRLPLSHTTPQSTHPVIARGDLAQASWFEEIYRYTRKVSSLREREYPKTPNPPPPPQRQTKHQPRDWNTVPHIRSHECRVTNP